MSTEVSTEQLIDGCSPTIFVSDLARAVSFYTQTLGLKVAYQAADHFAMIDVGDGAVKLAFLSDPDGTGLYLCEAAQPL